MRRLALEAGCAIMEIYNGPDFEVKTKSDSSPVTAADEAADAIISDGLQAAFPDVACQKSSWTKPSAALPSHFLSLVTKWLDIEHLQAAASAADLFDSMIG